MSQLKFYAGLFFITACTLMLQVLQARIGFPIAPEQLSNMFDNFSYGTYKIM